MDDLNIGQHNQIIHSKNCSSCKAIIPIPKIGLIKHGYWFLFVPWSNALTARWKLLSFGINISPLHVGISLRSALKGTLSGSLSVTLADESWKSPLIEDKKYNHYIRWRHIKKIVLLKCSYISGIFDLIQGVRQEKMNW